MGQRLRDTQSLSNRPTNLPSELGDDARLGLHSQAATRRNTVLPRPNLRPPYRGRGLVASARTCRSSMEPPENECRMNPHYVASLRAQPATSRFSDCVPPRQTPNSPQRAAPTTAWLAHRYRLLQNQDNLAAPEYFTTLRNLLH